MNSNENNISIDPTKLKRLKNQIYHLERQNVKKKCPIPDAEMVDRIRKMIEEEVKKCY